MNEKIENIINFIRDARDAADNTGERIFYFFVFCMMGTGIIFIGYLLIMLTFTFPKVLIPIEFSLFILWQGYKRL